MSVALRWKMQHATRFESGPPALPAQTGVYFWLIPTPAYNAID